MFRKMRRSKQELSPAENEEILLRNTSGVLAVSGDGGYPYAVPLNYVFDGKAIYFHCAKQGHKLDAVRANDKVSFCVKDLEEIIPEKFTSIFRSVIVFGRASVIEDEAEKRNACMLLSKKFSPEEPDERMNEEIDREWALLNIIRLDPEHITGKQSIELCR